VLIKLLPGFVGSCVRDCRTRINRCGRHADLKINEEKAAHQLLLLTLEAGSGN
jgi:hypothetical protein